VTRTAPLSRRVLFALGTSGRFERAVRALPPTRALAMRAARRYVAGTTLEDALAAVRRLAPLRASVDLLGEHVNDGADADRVVDAYRRFVPRLPARAFASIDLSHLALDPERLQAIAAALPEQVELQVGAEGAALTDRVLDAVLAVHRGRVWATVQANLRRSAGDVDRLIDAGVPVRLVKGAYLEGADVAHRYGPETDAAYGALAERLRGHRHSIATHDPALQPLAREAPEGLEVLLGVREADARRYAAEGVPLRVYVPFGEGWFRYAMRRLAESRGA
jgi:proline dehydrogenase